MKIHYYELIPLLKYGATSASLLSVCYYCMLATMGLPTMHLSDSRRNTNIETTVHWFY